METVQSLLPLPQLETRGKNDQSQALEKVETYVHTFVSQQDSLKTRQDYVSELRLFAHWVQKPLSMVEPTDILAFRAHLEQRGLKNTTIHKKLSVLRSFYSFCSQVFSMRNPAIAVRLPKISDYSTKAVLSLQETVKLFMALNTTTTIGKRDRAILGLLLVNGLRTIEVSRANVNDIHEIDGIPVLKVHGKGGKIADTKLRTDVYEAVQEYLATREVGTDEPLFTSIGNLAQGRISPKTIQARVRYYLKLTGIQKPNLTAHSLRHTCAVLTLSAGADLVQVQRLLRHTDPKVTLRYIQSLDWLKDNGVDRNPIAI